MTLQAILRTVVLLSENGWAAIAVKATVGMMAAMLLVRIASRAASSLRHLVVAATFAVLLFLPVAAVLVPAQVVRVPVPPRWPGAATASLAALAAAPTATPDAPRSSPQPGPRRNLVALASRAYLAGAALLILSLLVGIRRVHRLRRGAEVSVAGTRLANEAARANGMKGGIEVAISPELAVPITFGSARPVILLPASTKEWGEEELARAIRHELEHIARGDWATQIVSRVACALYWPHPFVWVLWRRLRLEAERACDDAVIRSSGAAEPYAEQLVSLARRMTVGGAVPALSLATRSSLGVRVEAILDRRLRRAPLTRARSLAVTMIAVAFMLGVAPFKLVSATVQDSSERFQSADEADPLDTALLMAAGRDDRQTIRRLLDRGAKADAAIDGDGSPLIAAARQGHVEAMRMLIDARADVNRAVPGDGNPLTGAAGGGHLEAVRLLLDRGARIDDGVEGDGNALIMAAGAGQLEVVRFLLDRGAQLEKVVPGDENALIHASETGQAEAVRLLIARGANVNARVWVDFGGGGAARGEWRTALVMAGRGHHDEVVRILRAAGARE